MQRKAVGTVDLPFPAASFWFVLLLLLRLYFVLACCSVGGGCLGSVLCSFVPYQVIPPLSGFFVLSAGRRTQLCCCCCLSICLRVKFRKKKKNKEGPRRMPVSFSLWSPNSCAPNMTAVSTAAAHIKSKFHSLFLPHLPSVTQDLGLHSDSDVSPISG